jgi:hypothetical protein
VAKLRAEIARGPDSMVVEGLGNECFAAVVDTLGANLGGVRLGLLEASGTAAKVRSPGERLRTTG